MQLTESQVTYIHGKMLEVENVLCLIEKDEHYPSDVIGAFMLGYEKGRKVMKEEIEYQLNQIFIEEKEC